MSNNLKISNMIVTGKLPQDKFSYDDFETIIRNSKRYWMIMNEQFSPFLLTKLQGNNYKSNGKRRSVSVSIWSTGKINIVGVTSMEEAKKIYRKIMDDVCGCMNNGDSNQQ